MPWTICAMTWTTCQRGITHRLWREKGMSGQQSHGQTLHKPGTIQPKTNAPAQSHRASAPIPPVKWANNTAAAQPQKPGMTTTTSLSVPIPPVKWFNDTGSVPPQPGGAQTPRRASAPIPPVQMPNAPGGVQPQMAAPSQPKRFTAPMPPIPMPNALGPAQLQQGNQAGNPTRLFPPSPTPPITHGVAQPYTRRP